jgi:hypothetical protein
MGFPAIQYAGYTPPADITLLNKITTQAPMANGTAYGLTPSPGTKALFVHAFVGVVTFMNMEASAQSPIILIRETETPLNVLFKGAYHIPASTTVDVPLSGVLDLTLPAGHNLEIVQTETVGASCYPLLQSLSTIYGEV